MTLPYSPSIATFTGNGVVKEFPFNFKVWDSSQLVVSVSGPGGLVENISFTAELGDHGGTVTALYNNAPVPQGYTLSIVRNMPFEQDVDLVSGTRFDPQVIEDQLDKAAAERQQLREGLERAVIVPPGSTENPQEVAGKIFTAAAEAVQAAEQAEESQLGAARALAQVLDEKAEVIQSLQTEGAAQKALVQREGDVQFARIVAGNAALDANLATGITQIQNKGDQQVARVEGVGANQVHLAAQQSALATAEAKRAYTEAERAEEYANAARDLSLGVLPEATENFSGLAKLATKGEAETGLDHTKAMTPLRTAQAIRKLQPVVVEAPTISGPDSTREGAVETFVFRSRSILPATQVVAFSYSIDLTGEETRVDAVQVDDGSARADVSLGFGGTLGEENTLTVYAVDNVGNQSPMVSKKIAVRMNAAPDITKVTTDMPDFARAGQVCIVHFSGATDADNDAVSYRLESQHEGLSISPDRFVAAGEDITITLPDAQSLGALTWLGLRLRARDDFGGESTKLFTIGGVGYVDSPHITSPPTGATGLLHNCAVVISPFSVHAGVDTAGSMQVQAARDAAFTDIVWEYEGEIVTQVTPDLPLESVLHLRARHFGKMLGPQGWSDTVQITTVSPSISEPSIVYPVPLATEIPLNPVVRIATPVCVEQTWDKVQCRVKQGASIVYNSGEVPPTTVFATSGVTAIKSPHTVEVRVHGSRTGWGAWKSQAFTTLQVYLKPPVFTMPANNTDPTKVTITVAPPDYVAQQLTGGMTVRLAETVQGLETEQPTQLWKAEPSTSFAIPNCAYGKSYYVAVWWQGSITGVAKSVSTAPFTTMQPYVRAPQVRGVTQGQVDVLPQPAITIDAFLSVPASYYSPHPDGSLRVQYKRQSSNVLLHDSGWMADKASYTLPVALPVSAPVYVLVQQRGRRGTGAVDLLSAETRVDFTTINAFVSLPVITSPTNGATNVSPNPTLTFKVPAPVGQTIAKMEVQASTASDFSTIAWTSGEISPVNSVQAMVAGLNTTYYVRARYKGSVTGWTAWGGANFKTMVQTQWTFTSSTTFTPPKAGRYQLECVGGGGSGLHMGTEYTGNTHMGCALCSYRQSAGGGGGGYAKKEVTMENAPIPITVGGPSATSSIGTFISASGGGSAYSSGRVNGGGQCTLEDNNGSRSYRTGPVGGGGGTGYGGTVNASGGAGNWAYPWDVEGDVYMAGGTGAGGLGYGNGGGGGFYSASGGGSGVCRITYLGA